MSLCNEKEVQFHNLGDGSSVCAKQEESVTSLAMARDGGALLVNLSSGSIQLWDHIQDSIPPTQPAMKYSGQVQGRFVIRSCFGGTEEAFVVSGSEDSQVGGGVGGWGGGKVGGGGGGKDEVVGV